MNRMRHKIIHQFAVAAFLALGAFSARPRGDRQRKSDGQQPGFGDHVTTIPPLSPMAIPQFQQLKKDQFDGMAAQIGPRLKAGYELTYLGDLKERATSRSGGLHFQDGGDDALATLSTKDGKVGGFYIE